MVLALSLRVARRFIAKVSIKDHLKRVIQATPHIEALARSGGNDAAIKAYLDLVEPIRPYVEILDGITIRRKDEQRKLANLKALIRRLGQLTSPDRFKYTDPEEVKIRVLMSLDDLGTTLKSLARIEVRIEDYKSIEKTFTHGPFTLHNKYGYRPDEYASALEILDKAAAAIRASQFSQVLYGDIRLEVTTNGWAGLYEKTDDSISLNVEASNRFSKVYTLVHEFGHRYWFKFISEQKRDAYEAAYHGTAPNLTVAQRQAMWDALVKNDFDPRATRRALPLALGEAFSAYWKETTQVSLKPTPLGYQTRPEQVERTFVKPSIKFYHLSTERPVSITDYGSTNVKEDFAEVFAHVVTGMKVQPDAMQRFSDAIA